MSQPLPVGGFEWVNVGGWDHKYLADMEIEEGKGMFLEVDLEFPAELHDKFSDYPQAPAHLKIDDKMISPFSR